MVSDGSEVRRFLRTALAFTAIGMVLYAGLYVWAEWLARDYARTNKFFLVHSVEPAEFDYVVLGASRAAALGYQDMTATLESITGTRIVNLAVVGGGVRVTRLMYEYFLARHRTRGLIYVVDSFAFYSRQWNEDRLQDRRLFLRAPLDPTLARLLIGDSSTLRIGLDYVLGFSKINDQDRFAADVSPEEQSRFTRTYRPVAQIDDERIGYLYPTPLDAGALERYLGDLGALLEDARGRDIRVLIVKPPLPARFSRRLPGEDRFDQRLREIAERHLAAVHDFTNVDNDDGFFYDTDHLNRRGVLNFFEHSLGPLIASVGRSP